MLAPALAASAQLDSAVITPAGIAPLVVCSFLFSPLCNQHDTVSTRYSSALRLYIYTLKTSADYAFGINPIGYSPIDEILLNVNQMLHKLWFGNQQPAGSGMSADQRGPNI